MRIAIVDPKKCKPKECGQECKKECPVVRMGKLCIVVSKKDKIATISEELCNGCNICTKKCPFKAITIINLPKNLEMDPIHRYGTNSFMLHRLPTPRLGKVLGLVGSNGTGKSTALKILANKLKPNLGNFSDPPEWNAILPYFRGSELQNYFSKIVEGNIKSVIKPQYVDSIPKYVDKNLGIKDYLDNKNLEKAENFNTILDFLDLKLLYEENRKINFLSGGELQRFAIASVCLQKTDIYMFDEPSSYLDVKQRLNAAACIRSILSPENYVICVEHDLSLLDYLSDFICILYGMPGAYGIVTFPFNVRDGINIFLEGFIPTENLRFRESGLTFNMKNVEEEKLYENEKKKYIVEYPEMTITNGTFKLNIEAGNFTHSQITVLLAQNGCGKSTFFEMLLGIKKPDNDCELPKIISSYKPQKIDPKYQKTVRELLNKKISSVLNNPNFISEVLKPLRIEELMDYEVLKLSGGELQRVAIIICLGKPADVYFIDEPSAYLDSEQRIIVSKVIKRFILNNKKTAFVIEHDFIMATYLADRVIYYDGVPSFECKAHSPESLLTGMNRFLKQLNITFRRDSTNMRPRINKLNSNKDTEQKATGNYFFTE
jgi:ATP-binding cassette subfamily E protein 1